LSESELIKACQKNDRKAQELLYNQYARKFQGVVLLYVPYSESKDILHEAFIKIFLNIKQYLGKGSFEGWMRRIVVNAALNYLRSKKRISFPGEEALDNQTEEPEFTTHQEFTESQLLEFINAIPDKYRVVFVLSCIEELSHKEIAEQLGITEENSRARLKRAKTMLKESVLSHINSPI
jgi:RNA polymerase sigma-70 factor (ECF subfamily)